MPAPEAAVSSLGAPMAQSAPSTGAKASPTRPPARAPTNATSALLSSMFPARGPCQPRTAPPPPAAGNGQWEQALQLHRRLMYEAPERRAVYEAKILETYLVQGRTPEAVAEVERV